MSLAVESAVPLTAFAGAAHDVERRSGVKLGVHPMALTALDSTMSVNIVQVDDSGHEQRLETSVLQMEPVATAVPAALWSPVEKDGVLPPQPVMKADRLEATVGLRLALPRDTARGTLPWMDVETLARFDIEKSIPSPATPREPIGVVATTIADAMSPETRSRRNAVLGVLAAQSWPIVLQPEPVQLERTVLQASSCFQFDPQVCALGTRDEQALVS
jgi:hypothetical protein